MAHLIVGLGNPGAKYAKTRHNIGYMIVAELARTHGVNLKRRSIKYRSFVGSGNLESQQIFLSLPLTYMNSSGKAVVKLCRGFRIKPEQVLVVHDEMDLPFGKIKIKLKGGDGGHKGVGSVIDELGTRDFLRLRVGIDRPPSGADVVRYVLKPFSAEEKQQLPPLLQETVEVVEEIVSSGYERAMNQFNKKC